MYYFINIRLSCLLSFQLVTFVFSIFLENKYESFQSNLIKSDEILTLF